MKAKVDFIFLPGRFLSACLGSFVPEDISDCFVFLIKHHKTQKICILSSLPKRELYSREEKRDLNLSQIRQTREISRLYIAK
jgi:hypothetical protein